jgi:hypothetical protein
MDNNTKEFTTPSGKKVIMKELTGGDFLDATTSNTDADVSKHELSKRLIAASIVSVDGATEDISSLLRALPLHDYVALSAEVAKFIKGDFSEAKTSA